MTTDCSLNYKKNTSSAHVVFTNCFGFLNENKKTQFGKVRKGGGRKEGHSDLMNLYFNGVSMNNLLSYFGLIDARMRASDKDLPPVL